MYDVQRARDCFRRATERSIVVGPGLGLLKSEQFAGAESAKT